MIRHFILAPPGSISSATSMIPTTWLLLDVRSVTIFLWVAPRPDHGMLVHYPIRSDAIHMDGKLFLAHHSSCGFDMKQQKQFLQNFPPLDSHAVFDFPSWWNCVIQHTQNNGGFISLLQTICDNSPLGISGWTAFSPRASCLPCERRH
jgi:hypothetical protein